VAVFFGRGAKVNVKPPLDIKATPFKASTPASCIAPPALIKGRVMRVYPSAAI